MAVSAESLVEYSNEGVIGNFCEEPKRCIDVGLEGNKHETTREWMTDQEQKFGVDLDLFGRFAPNKIPKKFGCAIYHYHENPRTMVNLRYIWEEMKCRTSMNVYHLNKEYTAMSDSGNDNKYNLVTRRCIWPVNYLNPFYENKDQSFEYSLSDIAKYWRWAIILVHGGKFAIAIFHGGQCVYHKTIKKYVVRSNGKRELNYLSNKTKKNKGSAGTAKREWNEMHLKKQIAEILSLKQDDLHNQCHRIFIHAPSSYNKFALFGTSDLQKWLYPKGIYNSQLSKQRLHETQIKNKNKAVNNYRLCRKDPRITTVPITTGKATLEECKRVHHWLSTCWVSNI